MKNEYGTGEVILLQTLDYFRKKVEALEGETYKADELDFCYNSLHEDYVKKCAEYNALKTSYDRLAEDYDDLSADLHQSADNYKEKINVLEEENNELKRKHQLLKDALDLRMTECDELKSKNFILEDLIKKGEEHYRDKYSCDAFDEMEDIIEDLKNEVKELQADLDEVTILNDKLLDKNESLNTQIKVLMADKESLIQKLQNINDEYLILHNEKMKMEKEIESLNNQINFEKEYEAHWIKVDEAKIADVVCEDLNKATTPISSEEVDVLTYMTGWEKAGY